MVGSRLARSRAGMCGGSCSSSFSLAVLDLVSSSHMAQSWENMSAVLDPLDHGLLQHGHLMPSSSAAVSWEVVMVAMELQNAGEKMARAKSHRAKQSMQRFADWGGRGFESTSSRNGSSCAGFSFIITAAVGIFHFPFHCSLYTRILAPTCIATRATRLAT